jgi:hypothetical protein
MRHDRDKRNRTMLRGQLFRHLHSYTMEGAIRQEGGIWADSGTGTGLNLGWTAERLHAPGGHGMHWLEEGVPGEPDEGRGKIPYLPFAHAPFFVFTGTE